MRDFGRSTFFQTRPSGKIVLFSVARYHFQGLPRLGPNTCQSAMWTNQLQKLQIRIDGQNEYGYSNIDRNRYPAHEVYPCKEDLSSITFNFYPLSKPFFILGYVCYEILTVTVLDVQKERPHYTSHWYVLYSILSSIETTPLIKSFPLISKTHLDA